MDTNRGGGEEGRRRRSAGGGGGGSEVDRARNKLAQRVVLSRPYPCFGPQWRKKMVVQGEVCFRFILPLDLFGFLFRSFAVFGLIH